MMLARWSGSGEVGAAKVAVEVRTRDLFGSSCRFHALKVIEQDLLNFMQRTQQA
jgi:hypothetical protein